MNTYAWHRPQLSMWLLWMKLSALCHNLGDVIAPQLWRIFNDITNLAPPPKSASRRNCVIFYTFIFHILPDKFGYVCHKVVMKKKEVSHKFGTSNPTLGSENQNHRQTFAWEDLVPSDCSSQGFIKC